MSRFAELAGVAAPVLIVRGERDPFGTPAEVRAALPGPEVVEIGGAVHSLGPTRKADDATLRAREITGPVVRFVGVLVGI